MSDSRCQTRSLSCALNNANNESLHEVDSPINTQTVCNDACPVQTESTALTTKKSQQSKKKSQKNKADLDGGLVELIEERFDKYSKSFEALLDSRLASHTKALKDLLFEYHKKSQRDIQEIKENQNFISGKFDELLGEINTLQEDNKKLKLENKAMKQQVADLSLKVENSIQDRDSLEQYTRRENLEIHGVPITKDEDTDALVKKVAGLIDVEIDQSDISVSHRQSGKKNSTPFIIVRFVRRNVRDNLYRSRNLLRNFTTADIGFSTHNKIFINESLTKNVKKLFYEARNYQHTNHFQFCWSRYGKIHLKKNNDSDTLSFTNLAEFYRFRDGK